MAYQPYASPNGIRIAEFLARMGDNRANAIRDQGDIAARGAAELGQIGAKTAGTIGEYYRMEPERRAAAEMQGLQRTRVKQEIAAGDAELAAGKKAAEDKAVLGSAMGSRLSPDQVREQLTVLGRGDLLPLYEKASADIEMSRTNLRKAREEAENAQNDYLGGLAATIKAAKFDPLAVDWALSEAEADGHDTKAIRAQLQTNPGGLPSMVENLIQRSPTQRKLAGEQADRDIKSKAEERALDAAKVAAADKSADNKRADASATETTRHNQQVEAISRMSAGRAEASAAEVARHNRAMEESAKNAKTARPMISGDTNKVADFETSIKELGEVRKVLAPRDPKSGELTDPGASGTVAKIGTVLPNFATNAIGWTGPKQRQATIDRVKQVIGKALEGGVLRKEDEIKYEKILPTIYDDVSVVESKLNGLNDALVSRKSTLLDSLEDSGYDVTKHRAREADRVTSSPSVGPGQNPFRKQPKK